jgi:hypothetical protein
MAIIDFFDRGCGSPQPVLREQTVATSHRTTEGSSSYNAARSAPGHLRDFDRTASMADQGSGDR